MGISMTMRYETVLYASMFETYKRQVVNSKIMYSDFTDLNLLLTYLLTHSMK